MTAKQEPPVEGVSEFLLNFRTGGNLKFNSGMVYLQLHLTDVFGQVKRVAICSNGHSKPWLSIDDAGHPVRVRFISSDGVRTRLVSMGNPVDINVTTLYQRVPSELYSLGDIKKPSARCELEMYLTNGRLTALRLLDSWRSTCCVLAPTMTMAGSELKLLIPLHETDLASRN